MSHYLLAENTRGICRVLATNVPTVVERYLDHDEVEELGDRGVAVTVLESDLVRDQDGEVTPETRTWLQQLVSSVSSASSSDSPPPAAAGPSAVETRAAIFSRCAASASRCAVRCAAGCAEASCPAGGARDGCYAACVLECVPECLEGVA